MNKFLLQIQSKKFKQLVGVLFLILLAVIIILGITNPMNDNKLIKSNTFNKTTGWTLTHNQEEKSITLPYKDRFEPGMVYQVETSLDDLSGDGDYMLLRSSMQDFIVYLDNQAIYTHTKLRDNSLSDIDVSMWVLVDLPVNSNNKVLRIDISSDIQSFSGVVNEIKFGHESDLLFGILNDSMFSIISSILLILSGLLTVGLSFFIRSRQDNRIMSLGLIFITSGIWILSEGRVLQFITGSRWIVGVASYAIIPLVSIIILLYLHDAVFTTEKNKRSMRVLSLFFLFLLLILFVLQIFFDVAYITTMRWGLLYLIVAILATSFAMNDEVRKQENKIAVRHIKYLGVLFISVIIEAFVFYLELYDFTSFFILIGFLIFSTLLAYDAFIHFKEKYLLEIENKLLGKMVYVDQLTGGKNRTAYERDLKEILNIPDRKFRLVISDLNQLKYINDNFGHNLGDVALQSMYNALQEAFGEVGECYRIGGDEMVVLIQDTSPLLFHQQIDKLGFLLNQYKFEFSLKVAVGSDVYSGSTFEDFKYFYQKVDKKMYIDKKKLKETTL